MIFGKTSSERKVRVFTLGPTFLSNYEGRQPAWGPVGYFVYKRTYARPLENGETEEFWQTCKRVVEGVYTTQKMHCKSLGLPWNDQKAQRSAQEMFTRMWEFKWLPPGRGLWAMGTPAIFDKGSAALNNCAFVSTNNIDTDFAAPFCFLMDMSMLGVGVGGDTLGANKVKIVPPKISEEPYIVEDSRGGWVSLVRTILNAFIGKGPLPKHIDYSEVRPKGAKINGFGGIASGPEPLIKLATNLIALLTPKEDSPEKITSTQIVDIFNYIGVCVVSGGVRRTAEIMFGSPEDKEFIELKQDKQALKDRRWASNNSIFGKVGMNYGSIAESMAVNGEPGIIWLGNMRKFGRMGDPPNNKDRRAMGSNPCSEQTLESFELCCLVENFMARHENLEDFKRTLKYAYLYAKTVTLIPTHDPRTNAVMMRNRRIGCSLSGIVQAIEKLGRRKFLKWCDKGYRYIKELDNTYSEWLCVPRSIKMTSVKPSGTVSLLCGSTPGIHHAHSQYYIRNIRLADTSPLVDIAKKGGHVVEKDVYADNTVVVSFPVKEEYYSKGKESVSIWEQFALAADLQRYWADNQVSVTITFKEDEIKDIKTCLEIYETQLKSVSLLPLTNHGYEQAPYIKIDKSKYLELTAQTKPLLAIKGNTHDNQTEDKFCSSDSCILPIR